MRIVRLTNQPNPENIFKHNKNGWNMFSMPDLNYSSGAIVSNVMCNELTVFC